MARKLNKKQTELLNNQKSGLLDFFELDVNIQKSLIKLNDYESLITDVERFLYDKLITERYK